MLRWGNKKLDENIRFEALQRLIWEKYLYNNTDSAIILSNILYRESLKINNIKYISKSLNNLGVCNMLKSENDEAIKYFEENIKICKKENLKKDLAASFINIGHIYLNRSNLPKAADYYGKSLNLCREINDSNLIAKNLINFGNLYLQSSDYDKSLRFYLESYELNKQIKDTLGIAYSLNNIASVYEMKGDIDKSLDYYLKSVRIFQKLGNLYQVSVCYTNIAISFTSLNKYDSARYYFEKGIKIQIENNMIDHLANSYLNYASLLERLGNNKEMLFYTKKSYDLASESGKILEAKTASENLYRMYKKNKNLPMALEMFEIYHKLNDSINSVNNRDELIRQEYKFHYDTKYIEDSLKTVSEKKIIHEKLEKERIQKISLYGGVFILIVFALFMYNRFRITQQQKLVILNQNQTVKQKNHEITQSIQYAQKIQTALLPSENNFKNIFTDSFVLFKPKDIVSGDFYWLSDREDFIFYATADSTGHGVPGGFMSMLGTALLNEIIDERKIADCGEALTLMREKIMQALKQTGDSESKDGMDMVLIRIDKKTLEMQYSAANNSLYIVSNKQSAIGNDYCIFQTENCQLYELPCDKMPVGVYHSEVKPFQTFNYQLQKGDIIYTYTDGYADQFGGQKGKKYTYKRLREKLVAISEMPLADQRMSLVSEFEIWKGDNEQVDDVCLIGVRI